MSKYSRLIVRKLKAENGKACSNAKMATASGGKPPKYLSRSCCGALSITDEALANHYFGSPNQAMHYLSTIAKVVNLTPEDDVEAGPRLRTQDNMMEWGFVCLTDKIEKLKAEPTAARQEDFAFWIATFDLMDKEEDRTFKKFGRRQINALTKLPPKA